MQSSAAKQSSELYAKRREVMVRGQIEARGVRTPAVLAALVKVPRHKFIHPDLWGMAYSDQPLPIGENQTISQPYIVGYMTEALSLHSKMRVLEIGTGSGYQAAVLAEIVEQVYSIEIITALANSAQKKLLDLGYKNIKVKAGDGYQGWPEYAPFDAIIVTAAAGSVPQPLLEQLIVGGRLVIPVGGRNQSLLLISRTPTGYAREFLLPVRFVPMTGEIEKVR